MKRSTGKSTQGQRLQQMNFTDTHLLSVYAFIILCYVKTIIAIRFTSAFSPPVRQNVSVRIFVLLFSMVLTRLQVSNLDNVI